MPGLIVFLPNCVPLDLDLAEVLQVAGFGLMLVELLTTTEWNEAKKCK
jgi:hypothetical protein